MGQVLRALAGPSESCDADLLKAALDASPEGMALAERGRVLYANASFAELFGYSDCAEVRDKPLADFRVDGQGCVRTCVTDTARISNGNPLCEYLGRRKDGTPIRVESTCAAFQAQERRLLVITIRDVSQRERRRAVRDSDRRYRAIFHAAAMGIVQCDLEGRVLETNPAVERMLGYTHEELRGMHFRDFTHPEDVGQDLRLFEELVEGKRESYELEVRYLGKGGGTGWVRLTVSVVRGPDGEPQFAIGMTEDITERKRAEQRLREAQKMEVVGRLVGGVAHDFNNLLTGIMLYSDLLVAGLGEDDRLRRHAEEIRLAGEQGAALIQQLLAISRQQVIEPRILCLNQTVTGTRNLLGRLIGENIELRLQLEERLGNVKMDPTQVQQILFNLVLNARDAISDSGCITVETANCELQPPDTAVPRNAMPGVLLAVSDTGCGMTGETRSHLFEPFFTTKTPGRGNGLGLANVYNIVKNNGGSIEVESEPGHGTRFSVILPRIPEAPIAGNVELRHSPARGGETVLLVEDNVTVRAAAKRILGECGYRVLEAGNGAEAIGLVRRHPADIHLLLADVVMPGMSGRELGRQLQRERPDLKALYMSGYEPQPSDEEEDPIVFFRKPFTGAALLDKVREILETNSPPGPAKSGKRKGEQL